MKRDGQQPAGIVSGTSKKEKIKETHYGTDKKGNYRPKKPSEKASNGHVIR